MNTDLDDLKKGALVGIMGKGKGEMRMNKSIERGLTRMDADFLLYPRSSAFIRVLYDWLDWLAIGLAALFALDRLWKLAAVVHFFRRPAPPPPATGWPTVTILSPITRGASNLPQVLACRGGLHYAGVVQHLLICDAADQETQQLCATWLATQPSTDHQLILAASAHPIATKIEKLNAALPYATGEVLCFVDDDVALRPASLTTLLPALYTPGAGAVFGLACYTAWHNLPTSLMSAFVNSNALLSYIPLRYLTAPFTITGHCFALRRTVFDAAGGFIDMINRLDDDHELARRVRALGYHVVQTPLVYDVENHFVSFAAYAIQMKRWFVFPQQMMMPTMSRRELAVMALGSVNQLLLPLLALLALLTRRRRALLAFGGSALLFMLVNGLCERLYLGERTPRRWWPLALISALIAPLQILAAMIGRSEITWRGQRLRIHKGGGFDYVA